MDWIRYGLIAFNADGAQVSVFLSPFVKPRVVFVFPILFCGFLAREHDDKEAVGWRRAVRGMRLAILTLEYPVPAPTSASVEFCSRCRASRISCGFCHVSRSGSSNSLAHFSHLETFDGMLNRIWYGRATHASRLSSVRMSYGSTRRPTPLPEWLWSQVSCSSLCASFI